MIKSMDTEKEIKQKLCQILSNDDTNQEKNKFQGANNEPNKKLINSHREYSNLKATNDSSITANNRVIDSGKRSIVNLNQGNFT